MIRISLVSLTLLVLVMGLPVEAEAPSVKPEAQTVFLRARTSGQEEKKLEYESLIDCLVYYESKGDHSAIGDSGRARGILQYWEATWNDYCSDYGNYKTATAKEQRECANEMIRTDFSNVTHWSVWRKCI